VEREVQGHNRNLVVMATGTSKTVVAELGYRSLREAGQIDSMVFLVHALERNLPPNRFDLAIVDEFHHASEAIKTYASLLRHGFVSGRGDREHHCHPPTTRSP